MRVLRRLLTLAALIALGVFGWMFARANPTEVVIELPYVGVLEAVPAWVALLAAFGLGACVAALLGMLPFARLGLRARRHRRESEKLATEVHQLRNLPLSSEGEGAPRGSAGGPPEAGGPSRSAERVG